MHSSPAPPSALQNTSQPLEDLKAAELLANDKNKVSRLVAAYESAGRQDDATRVAKTAGLAEPAND